MLSWKRQHNSLSFSTRTSQEGVYYSRQWWEELNGKVVHCCTASGPRVLETREVVFSGPENDLSNWIGSVKFPPEKDRTQSFFFFFKINIGSEMGQGLYQIQNIKNAVLFTQKQAKYTEKYKTQQLQRFERVKVNISNWLGRYLWISHDWEWNNATYLVDVPACQ